jgi:hypothetical protein
MKDEKIKSLEREIELLKEIIRLKDLQPITYIPYYPQPVIPQPVSPWAQPWPNYPQPYIGDWPLYPTITCSPGTIVGYYKFRKSLSPDT